MLKNQTVVKFCLKFSFHKRILLLDCQKLVARAFFRHSRPILLQIFVSMGKFICVRGENDSRTKIKQFLRALNTCIAAKSFFEQILLENFISASSFSFFYVFRNKFCPFKQVWTRFFSFPAVSSTILSKFSFFQPILG